MSKVFHITWQKFIYIYITRIPLINPDSYIVWKIQIKRNRNKFIEIEAKT